MILGVDVHVGYVVFPAPDSFAASYFAILVNVTGVALVASTLDGNEITLEPDEACELFIAPNGVYGAGNKFSPLAP